jgi:hypothetical protein
MTAEDNAPTNAAKSLRLDFEQVDIWNSYLAESDKEKDEPSFTFSTDGNASSVVQLGENDNQEIFFGTWVMILLILNSPWEMRYTSWTLQHGMRRWTSH